MTDPFRQPWAGSARRAATALICGVLVVTASACTGGDPAAAPSPQQSPTPSPTEGSTATLAPKPVPARVRVTRVSGRLKEKDKTVLAAKVGKVVSAYFDDAFLGGDYPRSDFGDAFDTFSSGAARLARRDRDLLTNAELGPTTESVVARRQTAYLSVLAPRKIAAGVTALVNLRYLAERADEPDQEVTVKGRLILTRKRSGGWKIFGYDLTRSAHTVGES